MRNWKIKDGLPPSAPFSVSFNEELKVCKGQTATQVDKVSFNEELKVYYKNDFIGNDRYPLMRNWKYHNSTRVSSMSEEYPLMRNWKIQ